MEIQNLRKDIILKKGVHYFDFAASALALKSVEARLKNILLTYANTHSDSALHSFKTQNLYENARKEIKACLGLNDDFALIACGYGSSAAIKKFQELLGIYTPPLVKEKYLFNLDKKSLPLVIIGPYEHHSNELSFREGLCECVRVPLNEKGEFDLVFLSTLLEKNKERTIIISVSLASNVTGILSDYKAISKLGRKYKAIIAYDASAFAPYHQIDASFYDALFISSHKFLGGVGGCGLLVIKKSLCAAKPSFAAGGTVGYVSRSSASYLCDIETLEEGGTPPILGLIRASFAFRIKADIGLEKIISKEQKLVKMFFKELESIKEAIIYAKELQDRLAIFSFNIKGLSPFDLAYHLSKKYKIETRAGCACAGPYGHDLLGLEDDAKLSTKPGWLRVSLHYTHEEEDLRYFFRALKASIKELSHL